MLRDYISITKPGIIVGNTISVLAGFFLAAQSEPASFLTLLYTIIGVALVIASGCVVNNVIDRDIDARMTRTKNRSIVQGAVSVERALSYSILLLLIGSLIMYLFVNPLSTVIVLLGYVFYVFFYTMWYKRTSIYGTLVGSISGAVPPVIGYLSLTNYFSIEAVLLFLLFCLWQMPHSYAIAMFRMQDYQQANIPVLPAISGIDKARKHIIGYILAYSLIAISLYFLGHLGYFYLAFTLFSCFSWLWVACRPINQINTVDWAKKVFIYSLFIVTGLFIIFTVEFIQIKFFHF